METKDLNKISDYKGSKKSVGTNQQIKNAELMENVEHSTKRVFLKPNSDGKLGDFFNYYKQENQRAFEIQILAVSIEKKYNKYGLDFCKDLFNDSYFFTNCFNFDIVSKVEDGIEAKEISYKKGDNTITRYLVSIDNSNVVSVFNHFLQYAISSNRESVAAIIEDLKKESEEKRKLNTEKRREEKKIENTKKSVSELSVEKLLSMLTPDQIAAIKAVC